MRRAFDILEEKGLRKTPCRLFVLGQFIVRKNQSLSEAELEELSDNNFDRVTIYRTLKTFLESDILHRVIDDNNLLKFALCSSEGNNHHSHEHAHFKCEACSTTSCLNEVLISQIDLPNGYLQKESNLLILGICPDCHV